MRLSADWNAIRPSPAARYPRWIPRRRANWYAAIALAAIRPASTKSCRTVTAAPTLVELYSWSGAIHPAQGRDPDLRTAMRRDGVVQFFLRRFARMGNVRTDHLSHRGTQDVTLATGKMLKEQVLRGAREDRGRLADLRAPGVRDDGER